MWFTKEYSDFWLQSHRISDKIFSEESNIQKIEVYRSEQFGNILAVDEKLVLTQKDDFIHHEMLVHVPVCTHKEPKKVLVLGGGNGGCLHELLKYEDISIDVVEPDSEVIEISKEFFIEYIDAFSSKNSNIIIETLPDFVKECEDNIYDIVIVDAMAPVRTKAGEIFEESFFTHIHRILKDDGLCAAQAGSWWLEVDQNRNVLKNMGKHFNIVLPYRYEMYLYPGCIFTSAIASKKYHPTADIVLQRSDLLDDLKYYNSDVHKASFALPNFVEQKLKEVLKK